MNRLLSLLLVCTAMASAQLQMLQVTGPGMEQEAPAVLAMGSVPVGESASITLRVRNTSAQMPLVIRTIVLGGSGFAMSGQPTLPHQLAPGLNMDVTIRFAPRDFGSFSANFSVNGVSLLLTGSTTAAPTLWVGSTQVPSGTATDLGLTERGTTVTKLFRVENTTQEPVYIQSAAVTGSHFALPQSFPAPLELAPRNAYEFAVAFTPKASGVFQGAIVIDGRTYRITGSANEPPFPKPTIVVDLPNPASAQQGKVSVHLSQASRSIGAGKLRMDFSAADDAVRFLKGTSRSATFDVVEGTTIPVPELTFQTGTSAGTIVFTAEVGGWTATASVVIAPQRVFLEKTRAVKNGSMLEVEITGFDNTRSVDELAFTFYTSRGETIQPGAIRVNSGADFRRFFETSTAGGVFSLKAVFPVAGSLADIASTEVQVTSSPGATSSGKIAIQ
jgi:hypothetical protein